MRIAPLALLLCAALASAARAQTAREIEHDGVKRSLIVVNAALAKAAPQLLVIALHGVRPATEPNATSAKLDALALREGFVVAYPAGLEGRWRYPVATAPGETQDIAFLTGLIDRLIAERIADPARVYVSGHSNGGFMTYALVCAAADRIAAAAALAANMNDLQLATCKPARPVPIIVVAGTDDVAVPYDGWIFPRGRVASVPETLEFWRRQHACTGQKGSFLQKRNEAERTRTQLVEWTGCRADGAVRLYRVLGGGHALPTLGAITKVEEKHGQRSRDFETSEEVWSFFKRWSR